MYESPKPFIPEQQVSFADQLGAARAWVETGVPDVEGFVAIKDMVAQLTVCEDGSVRGPDGRHVSEEDVQVVIEASNPDYWVIDEVDTYNLSLVVNAKSFSDLPRGIKRDFNMSASEQLQYLKKIASSRLELSTAIAEERRDQHRSAQEAARSKREAILADKEHEELTAVRKKVETEFLERAEKVMSKMVDDLIRKGVDKGGQDSKLARHYAAKEVKSDVRRAAVEAGRQAAAARKEVIDIAGGAAVIKKLKEREHKEVERAAFRARVGVGEKSDKPSKRPAKKTPSISYKDDPTRGSMSYKEWLTVGGAKAADKRATTISPEEETERQKRLDELRSREDAVREAYRAAHRATLVDKIDEDTVTSDSSLQHRVVTEEQHSHVGTPEEILLVEKARKAAVKAYLEAKYGDDRQDFESEGYKRIQREYLDLLQGSFGIKPDIDSPEYEAYQREAKKAEAMRVEVATELYADAYAELFNAGSKRTKNQIAREKLFKNMLFEQIKSSYSNKIRTMRDQDPGISDDDILFEVTKMAISSTNSLYAAQAIAIDRSRTKRGRIMRFLQDKAPKLFGSVDRSSKATIYNRAADRIDDTVHRIKEKAAHGEYASFKDIFDNSDQMLATAGEKATKAEKDKKKRVNRALGSIVGVALLAGSGWLVASHNSSKDRVAVTGTDEGRQSSSSPEDMKDIGNNSGEGQIDIDTNGDDILDKSELVANMNSKQLEVFNNMSPADQQVALTQMIELKKQLRAVRPNAPDAVIDRLAIAQLLQELEVAATVVKNS